MRRGGAYVPPTRAPPRGTPASGRGRGVRGCAQRRARAYVTLRRRGLRRPRRLSPSILPAEVHNLPAEAAHLPPVPAPSPINRSEVLRRALAGLRPGRSEFLFRHRLVTNSLNRGTEEGRNFALRLAKIDREEVARRGLSVDFTNKVRAGGLLLL